MLRKDTPELREQFLSLYIKNKCQYVRTCREMKIATDTVDDWRKIHPELQKAMSEAQALLAEKVEESMVDQALDPKGAPVMKIFYLKNNWKEKYGENNRLVVEPSPLWFENKKDFIDVEPIQDKLSEGK